MIRLHLFNMEECRIYPELIEGALRKCQSAGGLPPGSAVNSMRNSRNISGLAVSNTMCLTNQSMLASSAVVGSNHRPNPMSPSIDARRHQEPACELKILVPRPLASEIHCWALQHLEPDPYANPDEGNTYSITSLYFDTPKFHVFRRVGSFGRSKYRIRRYDGHENIFFERKLKTNGRVSKRRTTATAQDLQRLSEGGADRSWLGFWYHRRLLARELRPVCQIRYRRAAWLAATPAGPLRLTLDDKISAVPISQPAFDDSSAGHNLLVEDVVLELKFRNELPALFKVLTQKFGLSPQPVSKYRLATAALGLVQEAAGTTNAQP